jgi:hypothetical protein
MGHIGLFILTQAWVLKNCHPVPIVPVQLFAFAQAQGLVKWLPYFRVGQVVRMKVEIIVVKRMKDPRSQIPEEVSS